MIDLIANAWSSFLGEWASWFEGKRVRKLSDYVILLGGASIVSYALRTRLLGKMMRTVEVPQGDLTTIIVRKNTINALKRSIIQLQPSIYPGVELDVSDIHVSVFHPPHFTEILTSNSQIRALEEGTFLLWSKVGQDIPKHAVDLRSFSKETFAELTAQKERDDAIRAITHSIKTPIRRLSLKVVIRSILVKKKQEEEEEENSKRAKMEEIEITELEKTEIVEILIDNHDKEIISLCSRYRGDPSGFRWHAINILRSRKKSTM